MQNIITTEQTATPKSRTDVLKEIRAQFGQNAHTLRLIDQLLAAWDAADIFTNVFGREQAQQYLQAGFEPIEGNDHDDE